MASELNSCVKLMEEAGIADGVELVQWREVFAAHRTGYEDVSMSTMYLSLVAVSKRKECFQLMGFSPEVGKFSEWAAVNGLDAFARHMSWDRNSDMGYAYGADDFYVPVPDIIRGRGCDQLCRFFGSKMRVGPGHMVNLSLPVTETVVEHVSVVPEVVEEVEQCGVVETVVPESSSQEDLVESAVSEYSLAFEAEVRRLVVDFFGEKPTMYDVFVAEYPMKAVDKLENLKVAIGKGSVDFSVGVGWLMADVVDCSGGIGRFKRYSVDQCKFLDLLRLACTYDEGIAMVREKHDGVNYRDGTRPRVYSKVGDALWKRLIYDDSSSGFDAKPVVMLCDDDGERDQSCAKYGFMHAIEPGLRDVVEGVLGHYSDIGMLFRLVGGRFVNWQCECVDDSANVYKHVVFVRYEGSGSDREIDAVWYGSGDVDGRAWLKSGRGGFGLDGIGTYGLRSCVSVQGEDLPAVLSGQLADSDDDYTYVKFELDYEASVCESMDSCGYRCWCGKYGMHDAVARSWFDEHACECGEMHCDDSCLYAC